MGGVIHHCATRALWGMSAPEYAVPTENHEDFNALIAVWRRLDRSGLPCTVRAVAPGDRIDLGPGRHARAFRAVHRVPTLGYALVRSRRRLREDLRGASRVDLIQLRLRGESLEEVEETVELAFCGDTLIDVVEREPMVCKARVLVLEATFLDCRVPVERARAGAHIHLDEVIARADLFQNEAIVLTHFSQRYSRQEIVRILDARLPPSLRSRVVPLLPMAPWVNDPQDPG
jgi:ribonuclease Z